MRHEGGMAMQIYSKLERALGSIHIPHLYGTRPSDSSLSPSVAVFALPGKTPAVIGTLGSPRKTANYTPRKFGIPAIRSVSTVKITVPKTNCAISSRKKLNESAKY